MTKNNILEIKNENCLVGLKNIPDESVDLIVTDPPYNLGKEYGNSSDKMEFKEYLEFTRLWVKECHRVLKKDGSIYVFMGFRFISYLYQTLEQDFGMNFVNWISWHFTQGIGKKNGFSPRHEDILMFSKSDKFKFNLDNIRIPQKFYRKVNNMRGANPGDVWEFSHIHYCQDGRMDHPTQKPEGLIERIVLASSNEGDFVLDPFSGSGTTLRVCQQLNRSCMGFEINKEYCKMTENRLKMPFNGFDSIDMNMTRIPNDLNDVAIQEEYYNNHIKWFLGNHADKLEDFNRDWNKKYPAKMTKKYKDLIKIETSQTSLLYS